MVTGEYSRGASGFWIENGELAYPVVGGDDRLQSEGHVPQHGSGQRRRPQFRHGRADAADRRHDACRQLDAATLELPTISRCSRDAAREAGAIAHAASSSSEPGSLDEGRHLAGQRGRLCGRPLICARRCLRRGPDYGWLSEETADEPGAACGAPHLRRRPDRRHARLPRRPATWCVSVAVVEDGQPLAGVLECPATGEIYSGERRASGAC